VEQILKDGIDRQNHPTPTAARQLLLLARQHIRDSGKAPSLEGYTIGGDSYLRSAEEILQDLRTYLGQLRLLV
jgi:hypothetical protein